MKYTFLLVLMTFSISMQSCKSDKSNVVSKDDTTKSVTETEVEVKDEKADSKDAVIEDTAVAKGEVGKPATASKATTNTSKPKTSPQKTNTTKDNSKSIETKNSEQESSKPIDKTSNQVTPKTKSQTDVVTDNTGNENSTTTSSNTGKSSPVTTKPAKEETKPAKPQVISSIIGAPNHDKFTALLAANVSDNGDVNYKNLKAKEQQLDKYLAILEGSKPSDSWNRNEKLAFWINAYNAYTIKLILNNYPLKSITDLHGGKPWDVKWINLDGKTLSLNNIENDIIRPTFKEPRIHFAVNCAAKSCPPLLNSAFTANNLERQLEKRTKQFINNPKYNTIASDKIFISKIFEWYAVDFGDIATYIHKYATKVDKDAKISYQEYDWALNGK